MSATAPGSGEGLQRGLELAYRFLGRRERTTAEVRGWLERHGIDRAGAELVVSELTELGYLDDARYARVFIEDKRALEQWGTERIRRVLRELGIEHELIESALGMTDGDTELERALGLLQQRFPEPPADRRQRERALGMMLRKGYDSELALDALAAYGREQPSDCAAPAPVLRWSQRTNGPQGYRKDQQTS